MMQARKKLIEEEEEANEIIRRLKHGSSKYIELAHKPFTAEFWITWPPKNEKQTFSQEEETCPGCRRDNTKASGTT